MEKKLEVKKAFDKTLIEFIQPQGGISFRALDYVRTGTGYEACIEIYDFPTYLESHWLSDVCYINGAITVIDISTENIEEVKKNLNKSLKEQKTRVTTEKEEGDAMDASNAFDDLQYLYQKIVRANTILKSVIIRIFIKGRTLAELELKEEEVLKNLNEFKGAVMLNEQYFEWKSVYLPYKEQLKMPNARVGQPLVDEAIAGGNPFHFSSLSDPEGNYIGNTPCGGSVLFYLFTKTTRRAYYNALIFGDMGSGKSTLLKKISHDSFIRGDFVRMFDVSGECSYLCECAGGKQINLDGTNGLINMFHILKVDESEHVCYTTHISKLNVIFEILAGERNAQEIIAFENAVREMYEEMEIIPDEFTKQTRITDFKASEYPTVSIFIEYINKKINNIAKTKEKGKEKLNEIELIRLYNVGEIFKKIKINYGNLLDGPTSIDNIMDTQFVVFNISNIVKIEPSIADVILFSTFSLSWDNCTRNGLYMKKLWEEGKIAWEDIVHFLISFDELHKIVNAQKTVAIRQLTQMQREMRKVFGGMVLATQSISEMFPEGSNDENIKLIKDMFGFSNLKFIGKEDPSKKELYKKAFGDSLSDSEIARIPKQETGEFILSVAGDSNIEFKVFVDAQELDMFRGGA